MMGWMKSSSREVMMSWGLQRKKSRMEEGKSKINCARITIITFADVVVMMMEVEMNMVMTAALGMG